MTLLGLLDLGVAIILCVGIGRGLKNKKLTIKMMVSPGPRWYSTVLSGKGLTLAIIGWGISVILFIFAGLNALLLGQSSGSIVLISYLSFCLVLITMLVSIFFTSNSKE